MNGGAADLYLLITIAVVTLCHSGRTWRDDIIFKGIAF